MCPLYLSNNFFSIVTVLHYVNRWLSHDSSTAHTALSACIERAVTSVRSEAAAVLMNSGMWSGVWGWMPVGWHCHSGWREKKLNRWKQHIQDQGDLLFLFEFGSLNIASVADNEGETCSSCGEPLKDKDHHNCCVFCLGRANAETALSGSDFLAALGLHSYWAPDCNRPLETSHRRSRCAREGVTSSHRLNALGTLVRLSYLRQYILKKLAFAPPLEPMM